MSTANIRGFTLIELLISLAIFAVIGILAYSGLDTVLRVNERTTEQGDRLKSLQFAVRMMERDISQIINRPIRDEFGTAQPALKVEEQGGFSFTHSGWRNPTKQTRSTLQRVTYLFEDDALIRKAYDQVDGGVEENAVATRLLEDVESFEVCFLDAPNARCQESWPPANTENPAEAPPPAIVQVKLSARPWGEITRLFAGAQ